MLGNRKTYGARQLIALTLDERLESLMDIQLGIQLLRNSGIEHIKRPGQHVERCRCCFLDRPFAERQQDIDPQPLQPRADVLGNGFECLDEPVKTIQQRLPVQLRRPLCCGVDHVPDVVADVVKIITALVEAYPVIQEEVLKCWNKEVALFSTMRDLAVEKKKPTECEAKCWGSCMHIKKHFEYVVCAEDCIKKNCKK